MKAIELMIGDWVYCYGKPTKVTVLTSGTVIVTEIGDGVITPIPLAPEILEKNGWKELIWKDVHYHTGLTTAYKCNDYTIQIGYNDSIHKYDIFDGFISFKYIHELQHALRLCGLGSIADNFKI